MIYLGIDVHKKYSTITAINEEHLIGTEIVRNYPQELLDCIKKLTKCEKTEAVLEAGRNCYAIYDFLTDIPFISRIAISNPIKTKAIASAKIKTDAIDSRTLAYLLKVDLLPEIYVPPKEIRQQKEIIRTRAFFVKIRTMIKNRILVLLERNRIEPPPLTDIFGKKGSEFLRTVQLPHPQRTLLDFHIEVLDFVSSTIKKMDKQINEAFGENPDVKLLTTIPGIGKIFASVIVSEIGNINRFSSYGKLWAYAGLIPSTFASGNRVRHGKLIKYSNKWLKWAFIEGAYSSIKGSYYFSSYYEKIKERKGAPTAIVATARKLAKVIYIILKEKRSYVEVVSPNTLQKRLSFKGSGQE